MKIAIREFLRYRLSDTINAKVTLSDQKRKWSGLSTRSHDFGVYRIWKTVLQEFPIIK